MNRYTRLIPLLVSSLLVLAVTPFPVRAAAQESRGELMVHISDILGRDLPAKIVLRRGRPHEPVTVMVPTGSAQETLPEGSYKAFVYVYDFGVPVLVDIRDIAISAARQAAILLDIVEGASGQSSLLDFDRDMDLVLDRVEIEAGTDPEDPGSAPDQSPVPLDNKVLDKKPGWYRGELHVRSRHGTGTESVAQIIRRAERARLDFLAITDRNTVAASLDPDFKSDRVVLIPALEWGDESRGIALIYGPRTIPEPAESYQHAQALVRRVQAQGGVFAIAHPCFAHAPWQWGLDYVNAVQVWFRGWREPPPAQWQHLRPEAQARGPERPARREMTGEVIPGQFVPGRPLYPIAQAAATENLSANGKAELFWDIHMGSGLKASPIAGSMSAGPKVPLGSPVTYVYAYEKSLAGIMDGLRRGRTFVSSGLDGPTINFLADVNNDGTINISTGGVIPLGITTKFIINVKRAKGRKLQVFCDGSPILSVSIDKDSYFQDLEVTPQQYHVYRVRVVSEPDPRASTRGAGPAFGDLDVHAISGPIYAQNLALFRREEETDGDPTNDWISIPTDALPPIYATGVKTGDGRTYVHIDRSSPWELYQRQDAPPVPLDEGSQVTELHPQILE